MNEICDVIKVNLNDGVKWQKGAMLYLYPFYDKYFKYILNNKRNAPLAFISL